MGATTIAQEFERGRMFTALIVESNSLIPKLLPQFIKSIDLSQRSLPSSLKALTSSRATGSGSIEQVNFTEASHFNYVKHQIDEVDRENYMCRNMIEGEALGDMLESIDYEVKFDPASGGGSTCKMTSKYNTAGDFCVDEEEISGGKEKATAIYKVVEAYLLENPRVSA